MPRRRQKVTRSYAWMFSKNRMRRLVNKAILAPDAEKAGRQAFSKIPRNTLIHRFRNFADVTSPAGPILSAPGGTNYAFVFKLSQLANANTLSALYDEFRIEGIRVHLYPQAVTTFAGPSGVAVPNVPTHAIYAIDYDDDGATTYAELKQYGNAKEIALIPGKKHTITFQPSLNLAAENTILAQLANQKMVWTDMANYTTAEYFGFKIALPSAGWTDAMVVQIQVEMAVACRSVR